MPRPAFLLNCFCVLSSGCWISPSDWSEWNAKHGTFDTDQMEGDTDTDSDADTDTDTDSDVDTVDDDGDGYSEAEGDCDDNNAAINPAATDMVGDDYDQNCDGVDGTDADGDGHAAEWSGGDDCDDTAPSVSPDVTEIWYDSVDQDCSGGSDYDQDGDGHDSDTFSGDDCDDLDASINPAADEVCDEVDNDCDGDIDEDDATDAPTWYADTDGDSFGDPGEEAFSCNQPSGFVSDGTDCLDSDAAINPDATEVCDGIDNDCDGDIDDEDSSITGQGTWYRDGDADGYGDTATTTIACFQPSGYVADSTDCDDAEATIFPGADEYCDGTDRDCDGLVDQDDAVDAGIWFLDADNDGYGDIGSVRHSCVGATSEVEDGGDCDDTDPEVNPGVSEVCNNGIDDDCSGTAEGCGFLEERDLADADAQWTGETDGDHAGCAVAVGDVNGDGRKDILIGAEDWDAGASAGGAGTAYLVLGPVSGVASLAVADALLRASDSNDNAGGAVSFGDVDNDGLDEVIVGAWKDDEGSGLAGAVYVFGTTPSGTTQLSSASTKLVGEYLMDCAGYSVASGDFDGDGYDAVLTGAFRESTGGNYAGAVYVVDGPMSGTTDLSLAGAKLLGENAEDYAGCAVATGDMDGDGLDDAVVGAEGEDTGGSCAGAAYMVLGPIGGTADLSVADLKMVGESSGDSAGYALSTGDFDGDGNDEILVGAYGHDAGGSSAGATYVVDVSGLSSSTLGLAFADAVLVGEASGDYAGISLTAGDVDNDGVEDAVIGAKNADSPSGESDAGAVYVVLGPLSGTIDLSLYNGKIVGENSGDHAGSALAIGDIDANGMEDIVIGAPYTGTYSAGSVFVVLGATE